MVSHQSFQKSYIQTALWLAFLGGFMLGTHIALPMGFGWNLPPSYAIWVQTHGHLQLLGWTGLFIMGVSLYFFPRFVKVPLPYQYLTRWILLSITVGLLIKTSAILAMPYLERAIVQSVLTKLARLGSILEWIGIQAYLFLLISVYKNKPRHYGGLKSVEPFFVLMALGFFSYSTLNLAQYLLFDLTTRMPWSAVSTEIYMRLVLFPVAFAFSVRTFPLFIQIPPFRISFFWFGIVYGISSVVYIVGGFHELPLHLAPVAKIGMSSVMLVLVYHLKLFPKMFLSPRRFMVRYFGEQYLEERINSDAFKKARPGYYDSGQYGRFELLIFSAYVWLTVYAIFEIIRSTHLLTNVPPPFGHDPLRHMFLLGFITLLIIGMAQRMVPGFMKTKGVLYPRIVIWTWFFGNLAVLGRVAPVLIPQSWFSTLPIGNQWCMYWYGSSGLLAIIALFLVWVNLWTCSRK